MDIIDATVRLYRRHFGTFLGVSAVLLIPFTVTYTVGEFHLLLAFQPVLTQSVTPVGFQPALEPTLIGVVGVTVALLIAWVFGPLTQGALAIAISESYLGRTIGVREAFRRARPYWGSLFLVAIAFGLIVMVGPLAGMLLGGVAGVPVGIYASPETGLLVGLLVGGLGLCAGMVLAVVLAVRFFLYDTVMVLEGVRGIDSMQRARALVTGYGWHAFGVMFLAGLAVWLVTMIGSAPVSVAATVVLMSGHQDLYIQMQLLSQCTQQIFGVLLGPVTMIAQTLLYYDLRIKREGFDLQQMAEAIRKGREDEAQETGTATAGEGDAGR